MEWWVLTKVEQDVYKDKKGREKVKEEEMKEKVRNE